MKILGLQIERSRKFKRTESTESTASTESSGGVGLSWGQILQGFKAVDLPTFYRCVEMIASSIAQMPIAVLNDKQKQVSHNLDVVWNNPGNLLTKYALIHQLVQSTLLDGNGYLYIERADDGTVVNLRWLESSSVAVHYLPMDGKLAYSCAAVSNRAIDPIDMIHLRFMSYDGINGISAEALGSKAIQLARATDDAARSYFDNNCNINGIISVHRGISEKQRTDIKNTWRDTYTTKGGGVAVLGGEMEYLPVSNNPNNSQMVESRNMNTLEVCRLFGVNPVLVGCNAGATFSNFETAQNEFVVRTLMPYTAMIEDEFTKKLLTPKDNGLHVGLDESILLRADKAAESAYYIGLTTNGILTINEAREQLGYQPVEGGDDIRIPFSDANQNKVAGGDEPDPNQDDKSTPAGGTATGDNNNTKNSSADE